MSLICFQQLHVALIYVEVCGLEYRIAKCQINACQKIARA